MKNYIAILSVTALLAGSFASCKYNEPKQQYVNEQEVTNIIGNGKLLNLNDLKQAPYMTEKGNYCDTALYRLRGHGYGHAIQYLDTLWMFSIDTIPTTQGPLYIRGRITTDDYSGNFYKSFCIQQIVNGKQQALRISVDAGSVGGMYPIGQEILIRVDGLAIGRYANQPQLCVPAYNNNIYAGKYAGDKVGWAPGRIPFSVFKKRTTLIGTPQELYYDTIRIASFIDNLNLVENRMKDGCLVCLENVYYTGEYEDNGKLVSCTTGNPATDGNANVFAPTTDNNNYPQSRAISDGTNTTLVSASEYAKFAWLYIPGANSTGVADCPTYRGNVMGILGYYHDKNNPNIKSGNDDPNSYDWSITIRSLDDLQLYKDGDPELGLWPRKEYGWQ